MAILIMINITKVFTIMIIMSKHHGLVHILGLAPTFFVKDFSRSWIAGEAPCLCIYSVHVNLLH